MNIENKNDNKTEKQQHKKKVDKKSFYLLLLFACIVGALIGGFIIYGKIVEQALEEERLAIEEAYKAQNVELPSFTAMAANRKIGSNSAKVKLYVISSFSCAPCADFYINTMPSIVSEFVDKKKLQIVFYDMVTDSASIDAAMLSKCVENNDMYFKLSESLYKDQPHWLGAINTKQALAGHGKFTGLNQASINACFENKKLYNRIIKQSNDIKEKYNIDSVPSFVLVRGKRFIVIKSYSELINAIKNF